MKEYEIYTDSSADLSAEQYAEWGVGYQPLTYTIDGTTYINWADGRELAVADFYKKLRAGKMSVTSQVNMAEFLQPFRTILSAGKNLLYIGFSSGLSGTVNSGRLAAEELAEEYPDAKILVVDSLAASMGQGLLVYHAVQKKKEGLGLEELAQWLETNKRNMAHWFTVDDLNFLKRGGRVSSAAAMFGTMLSIKPIMHVDNEGRLIPVEKVRGRQQSLDALIEHMEKTAILPENQTVFISHGDCLKDAQYLEEKIKKRFGVKDVVINFVGPVIGSHSGPGTMALFFMATER